jgi:hypothetical protein
VYKLPEKTLIRTAIEVKEAMKIENFIPFKKMPISEVDGWIKSCWKVNRELVGGILGKYIEPEE